MLELGDHGPDLHAGLIDPVTAAGVDLVYASGPLMAHLWERVPLEQRGAYASASDGLSAPLLGSLRPGDVVMVKGSLGSRMGPLADAIRASHPPVAKET